MPRVSVAAPNIVLLLRSLDFGGPVRQVIELAQGLKRRGWKATVVTFYDGGDYAQDLVARGVRWRTAGKRSRWDVLPFLWRLFRLLRDERPDLVYSYALVPNILGAVMRPVLPRVRIVWGLRDATSVSPYRFDGLMFALFPLGCVLSHGADLIISNSQAGAQFHVKRGYPSSRLVVIPNGTDTDAFKPDPAARREIRAEWAIADADILIGLVARLDRKKDHATFLRAAAEIAAERRDLRFVCVGDGPHWHRATLRRLASTLGLDGRLIWAGKRIDMPRVYNALDLAVLSSWTEGCPNVVTEAMASGVPCVVTDVGDAAKIVEDRRRVCPPRDPQSLARTLRDAASDLAQASTAGSIVRERVKNHFGVDKLVAATAQRLETLLAH